MKLSNRFFRTKDTYYNGYVNESTDARQPIQALMDGLGQFQSTLGAAASNAEQMYQTAKAAVDAINSANGAAHSSAAQGKTIIQNMADPAAQQADPSNSIITCSEQLDKVQQAYNDILDIRVQLGNAMMNLNSIMANASRQFV